MTTTIPLITCGLCREEFSPKRTPIPLEPELRYRARYKRQDLFIETCPNCQADEWFWIGIPRHEEVLPYVCRIKPSKTDYWVDRFIHHRKEKDFLHHMVWGSVHDPKCGHYFFKLRPVA